MIFVTVGSDTPFDRLIKTIDRWAFENSRRDVFAQIGRNAWKPQFIAYSEMLGPHDYKRHVNAARVVVGHAGMGTILTALQLNTPLLVLPRRGAMGETRNDHQMDTARELECIDGVDVAFNEGELLEKLRGIDDEKNFVNISSHAEESLTASIREFIHQNKKS
jgi:UDP-N-acetylglucosamine transferase subunit ALG13